VFDKKTCFIQETEAIQQIVFKDCRIAIVRRKFLFVLNYIENRFFFERVLPKKGIQLTSGGGGGSPNMLFFWELKPYVKYNKSLIVAT
jgi:hypothetical protein